MPNGRCRMHGGATEGAGAPKGNQNARKHGLFAQSLNETGLAVYAAAKDLTSDEIARDTAEFVVAQVAQACEYTQDLDDASGDIATFLREKVSEGSMTQKTASMILHRLNGPDIASLGKALGPLKGLLEVKKQEEDPSKVAPSGLVVVPQKTSNWQELIQDGGDDMES